MSRSKQALLEISTCPDKSNLLDQIFMFIGSKPEEAVSEDEELHVPTAYNQSCYKQPCPQTLPATLVYT